MDSKRDSRKSKAKLNPDAKKFGSSSYNNDGGGAGTIVSQTPGRYIQDRESDVSFLQKLVESRRFWKLSEKPFYIGVKCATCKLKKIKRRTPQFKELDELTYDTFIAFLLECEDKSKEYECNYCIAIRNIRFLTFHSSFRVIRL